MLLTVEGGKSDNPYSDHVNFSTTWYHTRRTPPLDPSRFNLPNDSTCNLQLGMQGSAITCRQPVNAQRMHFNPVAVIRLCTNEACPGTRNGPLKALSSQRRLRRDDSQPCMARCLKYFKAHCVVESAL